MYQRVITGGKTGGYIILIGKHSQGRPKQRIRGLILINDGCRGDRGVHVHLKNTWGEVDVSATSNNKINKTNASRTTQLLFTLVVNLIPVLCKTMLSEVCNVLSVFRTSSHTSHGDLVTGRR